MRWQVGRSCRRMFGEQEPKLRGTRSSDVISSTHAQYFSSALIGSWTDGAKTKVSLPRSKAWVSRSSASNTVHVVTTQDGHRLRFVCSVSLCVLCKDDQTV